MHKIIDGLLRENEGRRVPVTLFTKGGGQWLEAMADIGANALGLDWTTNLAEAKKRVGAKVALQGNIDPSILFGSEALIRQSARNVLDEYGTDAGHVFNLGHGISQFANPDSVKFLVDEVHQYSRQIRTKM